MEAISILAFIFTAVAISYWWLWRQRIFDKPWVEEGTEADDRETIGGGLATANTALFAFLAVVTSLFALFISAYFTRIRRVLKRLIRQHVCHASSPWTLCRAPRHRSTWVKWGPMW